MKAMPVFCAVVVSLVFVSFVPYSAHGSVTVPSSGLRVISRPALFGKKLEQDESILAKLQYLPHDVHLCGHLNATLIDSQLFSPGAPPLQADNTQHAKWNHTLAMENTIVVPEDGKPVALLAKRGLCSFEDKARTAMALSHILQQKHGLLDDDKPIIQVLIVFDDTKHSDLVPMSASQELGVNLSLLFVSYQSGNELFQELLEQPSPDGAEIIVDASAPNDPFDSGRWVLVVLSFFLLVVACLGCLLVCVQSGFIHTDGDVILIRWFPMWGLWLDAESDHSSTLPLLTQDEVLALPEIEFTQDLLTATGDEHTKQIISDDADPPANSKSNGLTSDLIKLDDATTSKLPLKCLTTDSACSVCLEEFELGEKLRVLPCKHIFHTQCILPWLTERYRNCPLCKDSVLLDPNDDHTTDQMHEHDDSASAHQNSNRSDIRTRWTSTLRFPNIRNRWNRSRQQQEPSEMEMDGTSMQAPLLARPQGLDQIPNQVPAISSDP